MGIICFVLILFQSQCYRVKPKKEIPSEFKKELNEVGEKALTTEDVPVAAILVYKGNIIGKGYNTVKKDFNLAGHAEINAINEAYKKYGEKFYDLDRSELILYTTFEPCQMCKGAMQHYHIEHVYFEKNKSFLFQVKGTIKAFLFELKKQRFNAENLQENLFHKHPDYPVNN